MRFVIGRQAPQLLAWDRAQASDASRHSRGRTVVVEAKNDEEINEGIVRLAGHSRDGGRAPTVCRWVSLLLSSDGPVSLWLAASLRQRGVLPLNSLFGFLAFWLFLFAHS